MMMLMMTLMMTDDVDVDIELLLVLQEELRKFLEPSAVHTPVAS